MLQRSRAASRAAAAYPSLLASALPREDQETGGEGGGKEKEGAVPLEVVEAIRRDVGRTFPSVDGFEPEDPTSPSGVGPGRRARSLANVLTAYAAFDPSVSYCQGMNFLGGLLLLYLDDRDGVGNEKEVSTKKRRGKKKIKKERSVGEEGEEQVESDCDSDGFDETLNGDDSAERAAFGLLTHLLMSKGLRSLYTEGMEALTARLSHLHLLLPLDIKQLFDEDLGGLSVTLFAAPWFMTAFASDFPVSIAARLVDAMLTTPPAVDRPLLRLAAACVRACRKELLSARDAEAAIKVLRRDLPARRIPKLHDLVTQAFEREWSEKEMKMLSSEHPRLTTDEPPQQSNEGGSSSPPPSAKAAPLPLEPQDASSSRGSSPSAASGNQQHRKLKWEDALLARRAASADREAAGPGAEDEEGRDPLLLPPPPCPASLSTPRRPAATEASAAAAEEALAELLSCRLGLDSSSSSAPPSPSPSQPATAAETQSRTPPLSSDSLWTSFRRAADEEPPKKKEEEQEGGQAASAAVVAARERAALDLEGWSSFQRSASLTAPPTEEIERDDE